MKLGDIGDVQSTSNGRLSVICGQCGNIRVHRECSGEYDEQGSEDHWIEGELEVQRATPGKHGRIKE